MDKKKFVINLLAGLVQPRSPAQKFGGSAHVRTGGVEIEYTIRTI